MKKKANRLDAIKMIISSKEVGSQEELLQEPEPRRLRTDTGHPFPRLETIESSQGCQYEWKVRICTAEQHYV